MLSNIYIENIAVIEKTNIDFASGFNVLTGETGAGKSIIIDAINAVLGQRTGKQIIRNGCDKAFVSATFSDVSDLAVRKTQSLGFEVEDDMIILQREMTLSGKNNCRINSRPATVSALKELSSYLINIHGQQDNLELMTPSLHLHYIDALSDNSKLLSEYRAVYKEYVRLHDELTNADDDEAQRLSRIDLLTYQIDELVNACITVGESEALSKEKSILLNSEKIIKSLIKAKALLDGDDDTDGVLSMLDDVCANLSAAARYEDNLEPVSDRIYNSFYELKDISERVSDSIDDMDSDPYRLEEIEQRLDLLYKLSRKYGSDEQQMLLYLENAQAELETLKNYDENREQLRLRVSQLYDKAFELASQLSDIRHKVADEFAQAVMREMRFLDMPQVTLCVEFETVELCKNGIDKLEFLISANPGETPKPVTKIASGGELSRMMLAIKTILSKHDIIETLIFDEIDTGISGSAASKVGQKLKQVSDSRQVICVTHQAQIAALADSHYLINKEFVADRTYTHVDLLDYDGRVNELARIIDGVNITQTAIEHAKGLLSNG